MAERGITDYKEYISYLQKLSTAHKNHSHPA